MATDVVEVETDVSLKNWEDMTEDEKNDRKFLRKQLDLYESAMEIAPDADIHRVLKQNHEQIQAREKELTNGLMKEMADKAQELEELESAEEDDKLRAYYRGFLEEHEIYYVAAEHMYFQYFSDTGKWEQLRPEALHKQYSIRGKKAIPAFDDALHDLGRKKMSIECSFYPKSDRVLNLMKKDHWSQPEEGEHHYAFDLLVKALGNNKQENINHIEQLVYWKYTYPEEYKLPCLIIYGEGGVGKNTFVKEVLGTLFGSHQVLVADAEKALGSFNGLIQGKTVVMIDEAIAEKVNAEAMKRTVGNRTIDINPKYGKQGEHDNTALYLAGGNDRSGAILLAGDSTDRRWSIIKVDRNIIHRLADDEGISYDDAIVKFKRMEHVYTDRTEVARWLHYLITKWSHLEYPPVGLHSEDYEELRETQKSPFDELMEMVFTDEKFEYIEGPILYKLYQAFVKETNPAARGILARNKFYAKVREWVPKNTQGLAWGKIKITNPPPLRSTTANSIYRESKGKTFAGNNSKYLIHEEMTPFWETVTEISTSEMVEKCLSQEDDQERELDSPFFSLTEDTKS